MEARVWGANWPASGGLRVGVDKRIHPVVVARAGERGVFRFWPRRTTKRARSGTRARARDRARHARWYWWWHTGHKVRRRRSAPFVEIGSKQTGHTDGETGGDGQA